MAAEAKELGLDVEIMTLLDWPKLIQHRNGCQRWGLVQAGLPESGAFKPAQDKILNMGAEVVYNAIGQKIIFDSGRPKA